MRRAYTLLLATMSAACVPEPPKPAAPPPVRSTSWMMDRGADSATPPIDENFWQRFDAPVLVELVASAKIANATVEVARARVMNARAQVRIARAALMPTVSANAGLTQTRTNNVGAAEFAYSSGSGEIDVAYDLDLFGGARAGKRAARARYAAATFDADAAMLVAETDVARDYVAYSALADRVALADRSIADARDLLRVIEVRRTEGVASDVDVGLQQVEVGKLEAQRFALDQSRRTTLAAIATLTGQEAPGFAIFADPVERLSVPAIDPGLPAAIVVRRPDIRAAEARIAAANGDVQQARAAFLPSLRLTASGLGQALAASGPYGATLTIGGNILSPIFQGGKLRGAFEQAKASQAESVALYRQTLLQALQEVVDALVAADDQNRRVSKYAATAASVGQTSALVRRQYIEGMVDITAVLDAQQNAIAIQDSLIQARQDRLTANIDLYKALGGASLATPPVFTTALVSPSKTQIIAIQ